MYIVIYICSQQLKYGFSDSENISKDLPMWLIQQEYIQFLRSRFSWWMSKSKDLIKSWLRNWIYFCKASHVSLYSSRGMVGEIMWLGFTCDVQYIYGHICLVSGSCCWNAIKTDIFLWKFNLRDVNILLVFLIGTWTGLNTCSGWTFLGQSTGNIGSNVITKDLRILPCVYGCIMYK